MSSSTGRSLCIAWAGDGIDGALGSIWNYMPPNEGGKFIHVVYCLVIIVLN